MQYLTGYSLKQRLLPSGAWKAALSLILFALQNSILFRQMLREILCGFMDVQHVAFVTFKRIKKWIFLEVYH